MNSQTAKPQKWSKKVVTDKHIEKIKWLRYQVDYNIENTLPINFGITLVSSLGETCTMNAQTLLEKVVEFNPDHLHNYWSMPGVRGVFGMNWKDALKNCNIIYERLGVTCKQI